MAAETVSRKFHTLDAMRGIAALAVVQLHANSIFGRVFFRHAGLAVDFFFMLSGFVLSFAYQDRLNAGWPTLHFLKTRLVRLYPLYLLGLLLGAAFTGLRAHGGVDRPTWAAFVVLGLLMLPAPASLPGTLGYAFPLNNPTWSLFYEIVANVGHALLLRRRTIGTLGLAAAVAASVLVLAAWHVGSIDCGANQKNFAYGLARVTFSYLAGIVLYRLWQGIAAGGWANFETSPWLPATMLLAALFGPAGQSNFYDLGMIFLGFPAIVLLGACAHPSAWMVRPMHYTGITSYAMYILHAPLFMWFGLAWGRIAGRSAEMTSPWSGAVFLASAIAAAWLADRYYDVRVRARLSGHPSRR